MAAKVASAPLPGSRLANEAMARYADGDAAAFATLYDAIAGRIEAFVRRRTRDPSSIDDIIQQTFERIHRARGSFIRGADVLSWAFMIARNLCLDLGARGWRERGASPADGEGSVDPLAEAAADVAGADRVAMARESLARLARAFRRLPEKQQLALELVRLEGFSMAAAADNLGVSVSSLKMSVFRGVAALRAALLLEEGDARRPSDRQVPLLRKEHPLGIS